MRESAHGRIRFSKHEILNFRGVGGLLNVGGFARDYGTCKVSAWDLVKTWYRR